jgi:hypothetical protein
MIDIFRGKNEQKDSSRRTIDYSFVIKKRRIYDIIVIKGGRNGN